MKAMKIRKVDSLKDFQDSLRRKIWRQIMIKRALLRQKKNTALQNKRVLRKIRSG